MKTKILVPEGFHYILINGYIICLPQGGFIRCEVIKWLKIFTRNHIV